MVVVQMVLQDSFTLTQYQYCERYAPSAPEKYMFRMAMQDKARHIAYGIGHLQYVLLQKAERRQELERYLDKGESLLLADDKDAATREAFAILFGGSKETIQAGLQKYEEMRERQVKQYVARLKWATLERQDTIIRALRDYAQNEDEA